MANRENLENFLTENNNEPYYILRMIGEQTSKWEQYPNIKDNEEFILKANQIQVLPHWVLWDIDVPKTNRSRSQLEEAERQAKVISDRLKANLISHQVYYSGGKGYHILSRFKELHQYTPADRQFLKRLIMQTYGWDCNYEDGKSSSKTTIQMPDTPHRKTLRTKTMTEEYNSHVPTFIPTLMLAKLEIHKASIVLRKDIRARTKVDIKETLAEALSIPNCVKHLANNTFIDGRERILFVLVSHWKHIYHYDELYKKCEEWCKQQNYKINYTQLTTKIHQGIKTPAKCTCNYIIPLMEELKLDKKTICEGCIHGN